MTEFSLRNLSVLNYANGFTSWHYKLGGATFEQATSKGFFANGSDLLAPGDMIVISGNDEGGWAFVFGAGKSIQAVAAVRSERVPA